MEMQILNTKKISELQQEFSAEFPFLKIEFFEAPYKTEIALPKSKMYQHDRMLANCRRLNNEGKFEVNATDRVKEFEQGLWTKFGLSAQVFRKSGNLWIETSFTDSWTLEQQNREGLEMTHNHKNPYKEAEDQDLTDRDKWE